MPIWHDRPEAWHEVLPGVQRRILAQGNGVMTVLYRVAPGVVFPRHAHPHVQTGTCLEGGGRLSIGTSEFGIDHGSSYLVPGDVPHEFVAREDRPSVLLEAFVPEREDLRAEALPPDAVEEPPR